MEIKREGFSPTHVTIIGSGSGAPAFLTARALKAMHDASALYLQSPMPVLEKFLQDESIVFYTLSELAESAESDTEYYDECLRRLTSLDNTALCVLGGGTDGSGLVEYLCSKIDVDIIPGISPAVSALASCGISSSSGFSCLYDLPDPLRIDIRRPLVVCGVSDAVTASEIKLRLMKIYPDTFDVFFYDGSTAVKIPLFEIDRQRDYSSFSCLCAPPLELLQQTRFTTADLVEICEILRSPEGCPWDREQTHFSLKRNLLEECLEVLKAIDDDDVDNLYEELGDVLLQIALHSVIAQEYGGFDFTDITTSECEKMIRRHPHVFAAHDTGISTEEVLKNWDAIKKIEKGGQGNPSASMLEKVGDGLPALTAAQKIQGKAAKAGFDFPTVEQAAVKVEEELRELLCARTPEDIEEESGDLVFAAVNVARLKDAHAETALFRSLEKFKKRFHAIEQAAAERGLDLSSMTLSEMDEIWEAQKSR